MTKTRLLLVCFTGLFMATLAWGQHGKAQAAEGATIEELQIGQHVFGDVVDAQALRGKIVIVNIGGA